jgi:hypothetical protein
VGIGLTLGLATLCSQASAIFLNQITEPIHDGRVSDILCTRMLTLGVWCWQSRNRKPDTFAPVCRCTCCGKFVEAEEFDTTNFTATNHNVTGVRLYLRGVLEMSVSSSTVLCLSCTLIQICATLFSCMAVLQMAAPPMYPAIY